MEQLDIYIIEIILQDKSIVRVMSQVNTYFRDLIHTLELNIWAPPRILLLSSDEFKEEYVDYINEIISKNNFYIYFQKISDFDSGIDLEQLNDTFIKEKANYS